MKYKNYLFDWDGSLGNTLPLWFENFQSTFFEFGVKVDYSVIGKEIIGDWGAPEKFGINSELFFAKLEEKALSKLVEVKLNPGAFDLIEKIKKAGGKVGVLTTSRRIYVEPAMKKLGILDKIDVFLGKEDVDEYKPKPEIINKALKVLGGSKDETVMIGDTDKDVLAAKNAGVASVLYYPKRYRQYYDEARQKALGADVMIEDFGELEY